MVLSDGGKLVLMIWSGVVTLTILNIVLPVDMWAGNRASIIYTVTVIFSLFVLGACTDTKPIDKKKQFLISSVAQSFRNDTSRRWALESETRRRSFEVNAPNLRLWSWWIGNLVSVEKYEVNGSSACVEGTLTGNLKFVITAQYSYLSCTWDGHILFK